MKKVIFGILGVVLAALIIVLVISVMNNKKPTETVVEEAKQVDNIDKYGYILFDNKSKLYHDKFKELKEILNEETLDETKYAKIVAEMFAADFYDLDSKVSNTDIGGLDFVHPDAKEDFSKTATDTMYKYVETNVYGARKQELPVVKDVVATVTTTPYAGQKVSDEKAYSAEVSLEYEKDMGYPTKVTLSIVHVDNKLYVVNVK